MPKLNQTLAAALAAVSLFGSGCAADRSGLSQSAATVPPLAASTESSKVRVASYTEESQPLAPPPPNVSAAMKNAASNPQYNAGRSSEASPTVRLAQQPTPAADVAPYSTPTSGESLPVDLPTALRLSDANNPTVALARARVEEAYALERRAEVLWIPDLRAGPTYDRHDGRDQQSNGTIFSVSKQSLFVAGGATLDWDTPNILFGRLIAQRQAAAAQAGAAAQSSNVQLDVALAYFDLLRVRGELAIYNDAMARAQGMLRNAEAADKAGLSKTTADINRARAEVDLARDKKFQFEGEQGVASARLARLLNLRPTVTLVPADRRVVPIRLIPDTANLDDLVAAGIDNRPEVRAGRALVAAASTGVREAEVGPFIPHMQASYFGGTFGGGPNSQMDDFGASSEGEFDVFWELHNLGAGDAAIARQRRALLDQASLNVADIQSRVGEEVVSAARLIEANEPQLGNRPAGGRTSHRNLAPAAAGFVRTGRRRASIRSAATAHRPARSGPSRARVARRRHRLQ